MTQNSKKFQKIISQVLANVNHVMRMCHENVAIASIDKNTYAYALGDKHVIVTACVDCETYEYVPRITIAAADSGYVEWLTVYNADYMECAYVYAAICGMLGA